MGLGGKSRSRKHLKECSISNISTRVDGTVFGNSSRILKQSVPVHAETVCLWMHVVVGFTVALLRVEKTDKRKIWEFRGKSFHGRVAPMLGLTYSQSGLIQIQA